MEMTIKKQMLADSLPITISNLSSSVTGVVNNVRELKNKVNMLGVVEPTEILSAESQSFFYTQTVNDAGLSVLRFDTVTTFGGHATFKWVLGGGSTVKLRVGSRSNGGAGVFRYNDALSATTTNCLSILWVHHQGNTEEPISGDIDVVLPETEEKYIVAGNVAAQVIPYSEVHLTSEIPFTEKLEQFSTETSTELMQIKTKLDRTADNVVNADRDNYVYSGWQDRLNRTLFNELCASSTSDWTTGTFDKAKLVFTVDDGNANAGYIAEFLSA